MELSQVGWIHLGAVSGWVLGLLPVGPLLWPEGAFWPGHYRPGFRKLSLHCLILEAMSSDPSSVFSAEEGQRVGSPWIVRKIFLWTRSTILSSVLVRVHSSAPYKRVGIERERVIEPV